MTPCRPAAQIAKIKAVADDVRGHPAIRRVAQDKLEARRSHPHLFQSLARARAADGLEPLCGRRGAELDSWIRAIGPQPPTAMRRSFSH